MGKVCFIVIYVYICGVFFILTHLPVVDAAKLIVITAAAAEDDDEAREEQKDIVKDFIISLAYFFVSVIIHEICPF